MKSALRGQLVDEETKPVVVSAFNTPVKTTQNHEAYPATITKNASAPTAAAVPVQLEEFPKETVRKLVLSTDAFLSVRISEIQAKYDAVEPDVKKLSERFGIGNEWRAFADRMLLDMALNVQRLKNTMF